MNTYNNQTRKPQQLPLKDYIGGKYIYSGTSENLQGEAQMVGVSLGSRRYVNVADLQPADHITALGRFRREHYQVKFPRDLSAEDFRNVNAIVSGGPVYNPWVEIFDTHLNFIFNYDNENGKTAVTL